MSTIGGIRPYGLAKYLSRYGWNPIILTRLLPGEPDPQFHVIQTSYGDVTELWKKRLGLNPKKPLKEQFAPPNKNKSSLLHKIAYVPLEIITYPDAVKPWYTHAIMAGEELLKNEQIDAIISSSKPETCHLIANTLSEKYHIPWIADFRDLWSQNHYNNHCKLRVIADRRLEIRTLQKASALVTVSQPLADNLGLIHPDIPIYSIPNGFDPENICLESPKLPNKFTITYTGTLYNGKHDPHILLISLKNLIQKKIIDPNRIEINFYGDRDNWLLDDIRKANLDGVVHLIGFVPRTIALKKQRESHLLLLLLMNSPQVCGVYTGKLFEYLAARRPIIAVGGPMESVVKHLLEETKAGYYITSCEDLETILSECYLCFVNGEPTQSTDINTLSKYSHIEMARKFADILHGFAISPPYHK